MKNSNMWQQVSVEDEPQIWLDHWQIVRVVHAEICPERFGLHFCGRNKRQSNGAVSSKIEAFDPSTLRGVTSSGRVYQLFGMPGYDGDAEYVLHGWSKMNKVQVVNATEEVLKQCGRNKVELDAQCNSNAPMPDDLVAWENAPPVGNELGCGDKRIGVAKGKFRLPDSIDAHNDDIARLFLRGSVPHYDNPTVPAAEEDREASQ